jgi:hypothetical protein
VIQRIPDALTSSIARFLWVRLNEDSANARTPQEKDRYLARCETFDRHRLVELPLSGSRRCDFDSELWPCRAITSMAAKYADHADYAEAVRRA